QRPREADERRAVDDRLHDLARSEPAVERDSDVVLELRLAAAECRQRCDRRDLATREVEAGPRVDIAVAELDDVSREVGRDVADTLDHLLAVRAGELVQPGPAPLVPIVTHPSSSRGCRPS